MALCAQYTPRLKYLLLALFEAAAGIQKLLYPIPKDDIHWGQIFTNRSILGYCGIIALNAKSVLRRVSVCTDLDGDRALLDGNRPGGGCMSREGPASFIFLLNQ